MEIFALFGFIAFIMAASHSSLPGQVKAHERKIRILNKKIKGENQTMSKLLEELTGKKCKIKTDDFVETVAVILGVDEEWIKMEVEKSKKSFVKFIKIDSVTSFEVMEDSDVIDDSKK